MIIHFVAVLFLSCSGIVVSTCQVLGQKDSSDETSSESNRLSPQRPGWVIICIIIIVCSLLQITFETIMWCSAEIAFKLQPALQLLLFMPFFWLMAPSLEFLCWSKYALARTTLDTFVTCPTPLGGWGRLCFEPPLHTYVCTYVAHLLISEFHLYRYWLADDIITFWEHIGSWIVMGNGWIFELVQITLNNSIRFTLEICSSLPVTIHLTCNLHLVLVLALKGWQGARQSSSPKCDQMWFFSVLILCFSWVSIVLYHLLLWISYYCMNFCLFSLIYCFIVRLLLALHNMFHTPMAQYSLFVPNMP